jgi:hypothetical protein
MNRKLIFILATACAAISLSTGCGKKEEAADTTAESAAGNADASATEATAAAPEAPAAPPAAAAGGLPGESGVRQALASKDYQGAVGQLAAMRGAVKRDQWEQYVSLSYEVRNALTDASATDPKAAEALVTFSAMNRGR